jgi:hypothetical protein
MSQVVFVVAKLALRCNMKSFRITIIIFAEENNPVLDTTTSNNEIENLVAHRNT